MLCDILPKQSAEALQQLFSLSDVEGLGLAEKEAALAAAAALLARVGRLAAVNALRQDTGSK